MKILLLGKNGQVGWELQRVLAPLGTVIAADRTQADLAKPELLRAFVAAIAPDCIVNAAAYTAVDKAESDIELANTINAVAVKVLAEEALRLNAWLIHYSTDYVFDGTKQTPYLESDTVNPLSVYGQSKLKGEQHIQASGCKHLIFRTSWVFSAHGSNFVKSMLRLAKQKESLNIVADQFGAPTSAELVADVTALCLNQIMTNNEGFSQDKKGIYHLVSAGDASWHSFAQYIISQAQYLGASLKTMPSNIFPISSAEYTVPATRPTNSRLNTDKLQQAFSLNLPQWQPYIDRMLTEITRSNEA
jgi:dTDP-4-dehydrorhamnose reductase